MKRWKLTIEYDGSGFSGWQKQLTAVSVQQTLEEAILKFSGEEKTLHVAGRTDAGVHAIAQVAHFDLEKETTAEVIRDALNFHVRPRPVSILQAEEVPSDFHARFDALARSYRYLILNRRAPPAFEANRVWHLSRPLQLEPMQEAAKLLIGKHDFSTFRAQNCQAKSPIKTLDLLDVVQNEDHFIITTKARSFLYHQVRNMVGSLAMVGQEKWTVADFAAAFAAKDRTKGGPTAPAQGLCFLKVDYPQK